MTLTTFIALSPILLVAAGAIGILAVDALLMRPGKTAGSLLGPAGAGVGRPVDPPSYDAFPDRALAAAAILGAGAVLSAAIWFGGWLGHGIEVGGALLVDRMAVFGFMLSCLGGTLAALMSGCHLRELEADDGQFHAVMMLSTCGAMLLCASTSFVMLFVSMETLGLGAYLLTGMRRASPLSMEGSVKYFLSGAFASAILLYGLAFLYGETGALGFDDMGRALDARHAAMPTVMIGSVLVVVGLSFKVSAVPFHMWTPDAYQGAPTPATGYMAGVVKAAAFIAMVRFLGTALGGPGLAGPPAGWSWILSILAVLTMFWGNLAAIGQKNIKRMLAYSSIAHAGYVLVGVVTMWKKGDEAVGGVLYYLFTYLAANAGAFAVISMSARDRAEATAIEDWRGFGRRSPLLAAAMAVFLLSLLGLPPFAGFFGKLWVFSAAVGAGLTHLAVLGMIASVVSAYYYVGIIVVMFMKEAEEGKPAAVPLRSGQMTAAVILALLLVLALGIFPTPWLR